VLLVQRGEPPYRGLWALPGGFVKPDEDLDTAAARNLRHEAGPVPNAHLEQLGTYGTPDRDPRMRVVSVAYLALVPSFLAQKAGEDGYEVALWPVAGIRPGRPMLAFDHGVIIDDAVERAQAKLEYTSLATSLLPEPFTMGDLRRVYEAVWGESLHPANFRRKVLATAGFVAPTGEQTNTGRGRAELYRRGTTATLNPPLSRRAQLNSDDRDGSDAL
jgi:8-oxo-dGTP diphosphatase